MNREASARPQVAVLVYISRLTSWRVEGASGSLLPGVRDILIDDRTGGIDCLAVEVDPSGFGLDPRTPPVLSEEYILVTWRLARIDPMNEHPVLAVAADILHDAPRLVQATGP